MLEVDELLYKSGGVFSLVVTLLTLFGCLVSRWLGCSGGPSSIPDELVRGSLRLIGAIELVGKKFSNLGSCVGTRLLL